jgi:hypothetical protein
MNSNNDEAWSKGYFDTGDSPRMELGKFPGTQILMCYGGTHRFVSCLCAKSRPSPAAGQIF